MKTNYPSWVRPADIANLAKELTPAEDAEMERIENNDNPTIADLDRFQHLLYRSLRYGVQRDCK